MKEEMNDNDDDYWFHWTFRPKWAPKSWKGRTFTLIDFGAPVYWWIILAIGVSALAIFG